MVLDVPRCCCPKTPLVEVMAMVALPVLKHSIHGKSLG